jgi:hypothetical protein
MKTECIKNDNEFKPVKVVLTFESQKELDVIGTLFISVPVCEAIVAMGGSVPDCEVFQDVGADNNIDNVIELLNHLKIHLK